MKAYCGSSWVEDLARLLSWSETIEIGDHAVRIDGRTVPVIGGAIRFRESDGYNEPFALQWTKYSRTQLDHLNGTTLTRDRFLRETGWPLDALSGQSVLEAGCGAGRFTRILAESGACVVSFDYSSAVDANVENNGGYPNVAFMQCDIFAMPFRDGAFDRVFCHGVLQHTPDPRGAFLQLSRVLKKGGAMSIDIYLRDGKIRPEKSKYLWRWLTTRLPPAKLLAFLEWFIPKWLPVDTAIKRIPALGAVLGAIVPCWNYRGTALSSERKQQWAILDTFDALAPAYDLPATPAEVRAWFNDAGFALAEVREGGNGIVGNGIKD